MIDLQTTVAHITDLVEIVKAFDDNSIEIHIDADKTSVGFKYGDKSHSITVDVDEVVKLIRDSLERKVKYFTQQVRVEMSNIDSEVAP